MPGLSGSGEPGLRMDSTDWQTAGDGSTGELATKAALAALEARMTATLYRASPSRTGSSSSSWPHYGSCRSGYAPGTDLEYAAFQGTRGVTARRVRKADDALDMDACVNPTFP